MDNLEKLKAVGEAAYGKNWQSPISRSLGVSDRTIRNFISGDSNTPPDLSSRLLLAMDREMKKIQSAIDIINEDKMHDEDIDIELIVKIVDSYNIEDLQHHSHLIDILNNNIRPETWLSDLDQLAKNTLKTLR